MHSLHVRRCNAFGQIAQSQCHWSRSKTGRLKSEVEFRAARNIPSGQMEQAIAVVRVDTFVSMTAPRLTVTLPIVLQGLPIVGEFLLLLVRGAVC